MGMRVFDINEARKEPTMYVFRVGMGFLRLFSPLPLPLNKLGEPVDCEPVQGTADGGKHALLTPHDTEIVCEWASKQRAWIPPLEMQGRSYGFSSAYLAALGWRYKGPVQ